jgi:alkaline phosphatase D
VRRITRRSLLTSAGVGAGALLAGRPPALLRAQGAPSSLPLIRGARFTQGVASGQPATDGITLWTKLQGVERTARLQVEISREEDFRSVLYRQDVVAGAEHAFAVHHRVGHRVLVPGEQYFFRFATCDESSPVGRFRTARPADSREPVRVGFFSCQAWESGFYTAHAGLANEDLDLVVALGDYVYEYRTESESNAVRRDSTGANRDGEAETLADWREKYALYHSDPRLLEVRRRAPLLAIWDDHEVENNYAGDQPGSPPSGERRVPFLERRANGYRAFFEHLPMLAPAPDRIHGRVPLGGMADVFLLDQRQYRSPQPCGDQVGVPCPEAREPGRTMLGAEQKAWLKAELASSRAAWKIIGNQVMMMALDYAPGQPLNPDGWDGYAAERAELIGFLGERGIRDVTFVTGDIHTFFAGDVAADGRATPVNAPLATEFVGGSISSKGIADTVGREPGRDAVAFPVDSGVLAVNPHIRYSNQSFKGYGVLEAASDELRVTFRAARTTQQDSADVFDLARFRVGRGEPRVEVV